MVTRREIVSGLVASAFLPVLSAEDDAGCLGAAVPQEMIDEVSPADYYAYLKGGEPKFAALKALDRAFLDTVAEARAVKVTGRPAVWLVYNMGILVKTARTFFSVDLCHRLAPSVAKELDFALITHNHNDHYTPEFYRAMDWAEHKTIINNFNCNYGARANPYHDGKPSEFGGGFTRGGKVYQLRDVTVRTSISDHNNYLIGYTMPFEIQVGDYVIYHTGDTAKVEQLNPTCRPDLWIVHPRNSLSVADGVRRFHPKTTVIAHLNELTHPAGVNRWTWSQGRDEKRAAEQAGGMAVVPVWGTRIV